MTGIYLATEDELSEAIGYRLVDEANRGLFVGVPMRRNGAGYLKSKLPNLLKLAANVPVVMLADLDRRLCPSDLIDGWVGTRAMPRDFVLRIAVRESESWILADREGFAEFLGISMRRIPRAPEQLDDPKRTLVEIARRCRRRDVRDDIVPAKGSTAPIGSGYNDQLSWFVRKHWGPERAAANAPSLHRAMTRIGELAARLDAPEG